MDRGTTASRYWCDVYMCGAVRARAAMTHHDFFGARNDKKSHNTHTHTDDRRVHLETGSHS